jgi:TPR repeat protein
MASGLYARISMALAAVVLTAGLAFADSLPLEGLSFAKKMKLAKAGDETAQLAVAIHYEQGLETKKDALQAARWYREATLKGNLEAQYRLAKLIGKGAKGLTPDKAAAVTLLQAGADKGHVESENELGLRLQTGDGVDADAEKAAQLFQKAADVGFAPAMVNLGLLHVRGQGVPRDYAKAFSLFSDAAKMGDAWGLNNLGSLYEMGWGTDKDLVKARDLYRQAVSKGNQMAQANLSRLDAQQASAAPAAAGDTTGSTQGN